MNDKLCGKCDYCKCDIASGEHVCDNEISDNYGCYVAYDDSCEDWEE